MTNTVDHESEEWARAKKRVNDKREFSSHLVAYVVVNTFLVLIWAISGGYFWPAWVLGLWGIGLVLHGWETLVRRPLTDADIEAESHANSSGRSVAASSPRRRVLMEHYHDVLDELREPTKSLRRAMPEVWRGFVSLHESAMADGELPARLKEAVALTIGVIKRCDGCIAYHAKAAARLGATPAEVAELLGVALLMDGGTASVYAPRAWSAFEEFRAEQPGLASAS